MTQFKTLDPTSRDNMNHRMNKTFTDQWRCGEKYYQTMYPDDDYNEDPDQENKIQNIHSRTQKWIDKKNRANLTKHCYIDKSLDDSSFGNKEKNNYDSFASNQNPKNKS